MFRGKSNEYLLGLYSELIQYLRELKIIRTSNNPTGDYAEYLVCKLLDLEIAPNSTKSYDAVDKRKIKYQIKSRRIKPHSHSQLLGVIRNLKQADFGYLVVVIFNMDFSLNCIYKIPKKIISKYARYSKHQNGHILNMKSSILKDKRVKILNFSKIKKFKVV